MADVILKDERLNKGRMRYKHLTGRTFKMGQHDCYEMLRDMYKDNLNIEMTAYARPTDWWLGDDLNFYERHYKDEGFYLLDDPDLQDLRPFDVFLIAIPDPRRMEKVVTNHCAIYLGDGLAIHHRMGSISNVVPYRGVLRNYTTHIIRHKDVPDFRNSNVQTLDVMDYLLPHKRAMLEGNNDSGE